MCTFITYTYNTCVVRMKKSERKMMSIKREKKNEKVEWVGEKDTALRQSEIFVNSRISSACCSFMESFSYLKNAFRV